MGQRVGEPLHGPGAADPVPVEVEPAVEVAQRHRAEPAEHPDGDDAEVEAEEGERRRRHGRERRDVVQASARHVAAAPRSEEALPARGQVVEGRPPAGDGVGGLLLQLPETGELETMDLAHDVDVPVPPPGVRCHRLRDQLGIEVVW